ncbi:MAG: hypothetical protein ABIK96_01495 [bacterium]
MFTKSLLLICLCSLFVAQSASATKIYLDGEARDDDRVGKNLIFEIKDILRGSNTFELVADAPDSGQCVIASMICVKDGDYATAYSLVLGLGNKLIIGFWTHKVGLCGEDRIASVARSAVSGIAEHLDIVRKSGFNVE